MKKEKIIIITATILLFIFSICISYISGGNENNDYNEKQMSLFIYKNERPNEYKLNDTLQIKISSNDILIPNQNILQNIDSNIIGFRYSLDGVNYTSTIKPEETYLFKYVKDIENIESIYVKVVESNYNEVLTCKFVTETYEHNPQSKIEVSTEEYTNDGVTIAVTGIDGLDENYEIRYKLNDQEFQKYEKSFKVDQNNTKITAVIYNKKENKIENETQYEITNIDKKAPSIPEKLETYVEDNFLYIKAVNFEDNESGVLGIKYNVNNSGYRDLIMADDYYAYEIKGETEFIIKARVIDKVLNESEEYEICYSLNKDYNNT